MKNYIGTIAAMLLISAASISQMKTVIICDKLGPEIDSIENTRYNLFGFKYLDSAKILTDTSGRYYVWVLFDEPGNKKRDTLMPVKKELVFQLALKTQFYDKHTTDLDFTNMKQTAEKDSNYVRIRINGVVDNDLHLKQRKSRGNNITAGFGLAVGVSNGPTNINEYFKGMENAFTSNGWPVPENGKNFNTSKIWIFSMYLRLYGPVGTEFEIGKNYDSDVNYTFYSAMLKLRWTMIRAAGFVPYISAGVASFKYDMRINYGVQVNENGGVLDYISSKGSSWGPTVRAGIEYVIPGSQVALHVFGQYAGYQEISTSYIGFAFKLTNNPLMYGGGLNIYF